VWWSDGRFLAICETTPTPLEAVCESLVVLSLMVSEIKALTRTDRRTWLYQLGC